MSVLSPEIGQLTSLREIILSYNMLDALPKEMAHLDKWWYPRDQKAKHLFETKWADGNPMSFPHPQVRVHNV